MRPSDDPATRNLYLQTARDQLDEQFRRSRGMESRAATVATVACALAGVAAVLLKDFSSAAPHGLSIAATTLAAIIAAAYIGAVGLSLAALRPRTDWRAGPALDNFLKGFDEYPDEDPVRWTGRQVALSVTANESILSAKARHLSRAIVSAASMGVLTIGLGVAVNHV